MCEDRADLKAAIVLFIPPSLSFAVMFLAPDYQCGNVKAQIDPYDQTTNNKQT